jgi:hypothetical protein
MSTLAETLERFRRGAELLAVVLTGVYGDETDFAPAPGKWNIRQIIAHLADAELVGAMRFRRVIAEENPKLGAYDQDAWANNLDYARRQPKQSLESFRRVRAENYELLKPLPESVFERTGVHEERGELSLRQLVDIHADHAETHARQMQSIREEYKKAKGKK